LAISSSKFIGFAFEVYQKAYRDHAFGRAAELAYFFILALFPFLIFLLSAFSFMPGLQEALLDWFAVLMPPEAMKLVTGWVENVISGSSGGLLSFGLLGALWAASKGMKAVIFALNTAYDVEEERSYLMTKLIAPILTLSLSMFIVGGQVLIMFGDWLAIWLANLLGLGGRFATMGRYIDYLFGLLLLTIGVGLLYHFAPNRKRKWQLITPGAIFAVLGSVTVSLLFSQYLRFATTHNAVYGSLGAVIVLLLWLYLWGLALFIGGEINSVIERAASRPVVEKEAEGYHAPANLKMGSLKDMLHDALLRTRGRDRGHE
jgi:membrane protein